MLPAHPFFFPLILLTLTSVSALDCDDLCSTEFVYGCMGGAALSFDDCRNELSNSASQIFINAPSCTLNCASTTEMTDARDNGGSSNGGGASPNPSPNSSGLPAHVQSCYKDTPGLTQVCAAAVAHPHPKPLSPKLCTPANESPAVYTFYPMLGSYASVQRFFTIYTPPALSHHPTTLPVMLVVSGYGGQGWIGPDGTGESLEVAAAEYYGFALIEVSSPISDGVGGFGLDFGNNKVVNEANPLPCNTRDTGFLQKIFQFIKDDAGLDETKVYVSGFSQDSMFTAHVGVCYADKVAGIWQGGSGIALTGHTPVVPGHEAQCTGTDDYALGEVCCQTSFCTTCRMWPVWPKTQCLGGNGGSPLTSCIAAYTDDGVACGGDKNMYDAMVAEGNDARLLSFSPEPSLNVGGHDLPRNYYAWVAGCLGITATCSTQCEIAFQTCFSGATQSDKIKKFAHCEKEIQSGNLAGCAVGCSPSLAMLKLSQSPVVTLAAGKFGTRTGITGYDGPAPVPACDASLGPIGWFGAGGSSAPDSCKVPTGVLPATAWSISVPDSVCNSLPSPSSSSSDAWSTVAGTATDWCGDGTGGTTGGTSTTATTIHSSGKLTCAQLGWTNTVNNVCGESDLLGNNGASSACTEASLADATSICDAAGARLCSVDEIDAGATATTGCGFDTSYVWTSTWCGLGPEGGKYYVGIGGGGSSAERKCKNPKKSYPVRCCSDVDISATSAKPATTTTTFPFLSVRKDCATLGWEVTGNACGESDKAFKKGLDKCFTWKNHPDAERKCLKLGARMCSQSDIEAGVGKASGCGFDSQFLWTSTKCNGGFIRSKGNGQGETECAAPKSKGSMRCCSDVNI